MVHTPVAGYTEQPVETLAQVNDNKMLEERVLRVLDGMRDDSVKYDQRWLAIARTHIEQGFMAMNRAVFQPQRVKFPQED